MQGAGSSWRESLKENSLKLWSWQILQLCSAVAWLVHWVAPCPSFLSALFGLHSWTSFVLVVIQPCNTDLLLLLDFNSGHSFGGKSKSDQIRKFWWEKTNLCVFIKKNKHHMDMFEQLMCLFTSLAWRCFEFSTEGRNMPEENKY